MTVELMEPFASAWRDRDPFAELETMPGETFKQKDNRRVFRFEFAGENWFAKVHHGVGWREIIKNLASLRRPILSARNEWEAIRVFEMLGVPTLEAAGFGEQGLNPARRDSFLITREVKRFLTLEELADQWSSLTRPLLMKRTLIRELAVITARLHDNGVNHRDYYLCHFLLEIPDGLERVLEKPLLIRVVDLHRAMMTSGGTNIRWREKDLGALLYSSMRIGLTRRDVYRFITLYTGLPLRQALIQHRALWRRVWRRACAFHLEGYGVPAPALFPRG